MKLQEHNINIFASTECISVQLMKKYINNELSASDQNKIERHLLECDICAEQLEGLETMEDTVELQTIVNDLNKQIDLRIKKRIIFIEQKWFRVLAIAASIILTVSIGWYASQNLLTQQTDVMVMSDCSTPTGEVGLSIIDSVIPETKDTSDTQSETMVKNQTDISVQNITSEKNMTEEYITVVDDMEILDDMEISSNATNLDITTEELVVESKDSDLLSDDMATLPQSYDSENIIIDSSASLTLNQAQPFDEQVFAEETKKSIEFESGLEEQDFTLNDNLSNKQAARSAVNAGRLSRIHSLDKLQGSEIESNNNYENEYILDSVKFYYAQANYVKSRNLLDALWIHQNYTNEALFYGGLVHYKLGEYETSLDFFNTIILEPTDSLYEEFLWHTALCYKELGYINQTESILKQLLSITKNYNTQADSLLQIIAPTKY